MLQLDKHLPLLVEGMHGRGDCIHSRAVLRQWLETREVWLTTSWVSLFWDLVPLGLHVIRKATPLRTQTKNAVLEANLFEKQSRPLNIEQKKIWYKPEEVRKHGSVLAAMCAAAGCDYDTADFRLPIPEEWFAELREVFDWTQIEAPIAIYRPLCVRPEWGGHAARNPDPQAFCDLFKQIRSEFFWVSVADIAPGKEWLIGPQPRCASDGRYSVDLQFHNGELNSRQLSALFAVADFVFTPGGFPVIQAQAVGTPVFALMGGYEDHRSYLGGARFSPYLGFDTINPCQCFSHHHKCEKRVDMGAASRSLEKFLADEVFDARPVSQPA